MRYAYDLLGAPLAPYCCPYLATPTSWHTDRRCEKTNGRRRETQETRHEAQHARPKTRQRTGRCLRAPYVNEGATTHEIRRCNARADHSRFVTQRVELPAHPHPPRARSDFRATASKRLGGRGNARSSIGPLVADAAQGPHESGRKRWRPPLAGLMVTQPTSDTRARPAARWVCRMDCAERRGPSCIHIVEHEADGKMHRMYIPRSATHTLGAPRRFKQRRHEACAAWAIACEWLLPPAMSCASAGMSPPAGARGRRPLLTLGSHEAPPAGAQPTEPPDGRSNPPTSGMRS